MIIGLGHRARHGKDTVAAEWIALQPRRVRRFSFADDLKAYCRIAHGMTTKDAPLLQRVGVEMRETRGADVWIRGVESQIAEIAPDIAVITDVRFQNEAVWVKAQGGVLVKVERVDQTTGALFQAADRDPHHPTEIDLADYDGWDHTIRARSLRDLKDQAGALLEQFMCERFFHLARCAQGR